MNKRMDGILRRYKMNHLIKRAKYLGHKIMINYQSLGVSVKITGVRIIPGLKRYVFRIALLPGTRIQTIFTYAPDIQAILGFHLFFPFKEKTSIYIAVSEFDVKENRLLKILGSHEFSNSKMQIPLALGYNLMGGIYIADLAKLLHLLIVGPSGTGKSVALQCIVLSIIVKCPVDSVRLLLFDIGANSLSAFTNVKHLYHPIVKDVETGIAVLESLVSEMDRRLSLSEHEFQNYPYCVCIIDEFDDTIASIENKDQSRRFISSINSIIRRGRKGKVILILASHDPTLKNAKVSLNGIIPRIAFRCTSHYSSSSALGVTGAENLPGEGTMLFKSQDECTPIPLQGSFVTPAEIKEILINEPAGYDDIEILEVKAEQEAKSAVLDNVSIEKSKKELADILFWTLGRVTISTLQIQKNFKIGNRAYEFTNALHEMNIITDKFSNQPRKVIPTCIEDLSSDAIRLLEHYGHTTDQIAEILEIKKGLCHN